MALRLHLTPEAVATISRCASPVRERLQHELGALSAEPPHPPEVWTGPASETVVLPAGFRARYWLDPARGLLNLLDLRAPAESVPRRR